MSTLDEEMLRAHEAGDVEALIPLYTKAANAAETEGDIDATCFFLTHAYVFALEAGDDAAQDLHARLIEYGREE